MTNFGDMLQMLATNARFTPEQLETLRKFGNETEQRNSQVSGYTTEQGELNIQLPFQQIYSQVLTVDTATVTLEIPQDYKHLLIFTSGRTTSAESSPSIVILQMKFNSTTVDVYDIQSLRASGANVVVVRTADTTGAAAGNLTESDQNSALASSAVCYIPNYKSPFYKDVLTMSTRSLDIINAIQFYVSLWKNTDAIRRIEFSATSGNIVAGSIITVYGMN